MCCPASCLFLRGQTKMVWTCWVGEQWKCFWPHTECCGWKWRPDSWFVVKVGSKSSRRIWLWPPPLPPLPRRDDSQREDGDSVLNHHNAKSNKPRTRQRSRCQTYDRGFELLMSNFLFFELNWTRQIFAFLFFSTDSGSIWPKWFVLKGNLGYVCANKPGFVPLQGIPLLSGLTDDKIRCPVRLRQRLEEKTRSGMFERRDGLIVCAA